MITIKEIARKTGASIGTVDRVLHNRGRFSEETASKIRQIVAESGYKVNALARTLSLARKTTFGVLLPKQSHDSGYWKLIADGILKASEELKTFNIAVRPTFFDRFSPDSFKTAAAALVAKPLDGLLIAPIIPSLCVPFIKKLPENLPYVFIDTVVPESKPLCFVGQDSFQSGLLAGHLMQLSLDRPGVLVVLKAYADDYHITARAEGFTRYFKDIPACGVKVIDLAGKLSARSVSSVLNNFLSEEERVQGVFITSACTHYVAEYLKKRTANDGRVALIGYDAVNANRPHVLDGSIDFLISQRPQQQGYRGLQQLYRHVVLQEQVEATVMMPLDIVTKENINDYQN